MHRCVQVIPYLMVTTPSNFYLNEFVKFHILMSNVMLLFSIHVIIVSGSLHDRSVNIIATLPNCTDASSDNAVFKIWGRTSGAFVFSLNPRKKKNEAFLPQDFSEQGNSPDPSSCGQNVLGPDYFVFTSKQPTVML